jgi:hypothetical protein
VCEEGDEECVPVECEEEEEDAEGDSGKEKGFAQTKFSFSALIIPNIVAMWFFLNRNQH